MAPIRTRGLGAYLGHRVVQRRDERGDAVFVEDVIQDPAALLPHLRAGVPQARPGRFARAAAQRDQLTVGRGAAVRVSQHAHQLCAAQARRGRREDATSGRAGRGGPRPPAFHDPARAAQAR
jgi:hypothetical protein